MSELVVQGVAKSYAGNKDDVGFALLPVTFVVQPGQLLAVIGPSGCGKTTLLRCLAGLTSPDQGHIVADGRDVSRLAAETRDFGMIFQQPYLFPHLTVGENIGFGLKMRGVPVKRRREEVERALEAVDLSGYTMRKPETLSGGQQQRVALARALIVKPKVLLLDEPFAALDPMTRAEMRELVKTLQRRYGCTIVMVTHDRDEAFEMADRMAVMDRGRLLQVGSPYELYTRPETARVAELVGCENVLNGLREGRWFRCGELKWSVFAESSEGAGDDPAGSGGDLQSGTLVIRSESIRISESEEIKATIENMSARQGYHMVRVQVSGQGLAIRVPFGSESIPPVGSVVGLQIDWQQTHWIPEGDDGGSHATGKDILERR